MGQTNAPDDSESVSKTVNACQYDSKRPTVPESWNSSGSSMPKSSTRYWAPAVNRQRSYRRGTRRAS
eukprot:9153118-Pyramimonas_sp.AAC.1